MRIISLLRRKIEEMPSSLLLLSTFLVIYPLLCAGQYNFDVPSQPIINIRLRGFRDTVDKDFVFGGLFPVHEGTGCVELRRERGLERLEAMLFAIDKINNDMSLLPNLTIGYDVRDSCGDETVGLDEALDMVVKSNSLTVESTQACVQAGNSSTRLSGIVGAAASAVSLPIATLLGLRIFQIPLVSYASSSAALSNKNLYEYFLRTIPPDNLQSSAMVDLVLHFKWEYVSVVFNDNAYGEPGTDAFIENAMNRGICIDVTMSIPLQVTGSDSEFNKAIDRTVQELLNSTAIVVIVFTDQATVSALFEKLNKTETRRPFIWIASDAWAGSTVIRDMYPTVAAGLFAFQPFTMEVDEFAEYFSSLRPSTNQRDHFFSEFYEEICGNNAADCPNGSITDHVNYEQGNIVPLVIDAVYVYAHALQNFLDDNCDSPLVWNPFDHTCTGMRHSLTGENLLGYLFNVTFSGTQNRTVSFNENGDPQGVYRITNLQRKNNRQYEYVSFGFWDSENGGVLTLLNSTQQFGINNNGDVIIDIPTSSCSEPCQGGTRRSITNANCPACFECIPCTGPNYSTNVSATNCSLCSFNHWGNKPLSGSTHCVPVKVRHLEYSNGWAVAAMSIASLGILMLAAVIVIFAIHWNTPVVKSSGREQMIMLMVGIGLCFVLTYIVVSPPSTAVCVFHRVGVWLCFSIAFGALMIKIVRVARIFYWRNSSTKRPPFTDPIHQIIFTVLVVAGQMILVAISLGIDPPLVDRSPDIVRTNPTQTGNAPEIVETCQEPHIALLILLLLYNCVLILICTILGWMTRRFPGNFNEARHVMFTSFTVMAVWVLFVPLFFVTENEFRIGILALGIVLSAVGLMVGIFTPKIFIMIFQRHKNNKQYAVQQQQAAIIGSPSSNFSVQGSKVSVCKLNCNLLAGYNKTPFLICIFSSRSGLN